MPASDWSELIGSALIGRNDRSSQRGVIDVDKDGSNVEVCELIFSI